MSINQRLNSNVVFQRAFHVILRPKYLRKVLTGQVETRLKDPILRVVPECRAWIIELEVMPDYFRLLVEVDPQFGVNNLVHRLKGQSSQVLRQESPQLRRLPSLWTNSYFVATVGCAPLEIIRRYVENQKVT